jgi:DNA-binding LacI/PurR family transcriptional regulator
MADVARLAGVSHQTVSRVVNGHRSVTPATRNRVEVAIAQLGYRRNTAARALVTRRSGVLGVVSVDTSHYGPASTLLSIEEAARSVGYFVSFVSVKTVDQLEMRAALDHLMTANVDGIVVIAPMRAAVEAVHGLASEVPLVVVEGTGSAGVASVVIDQVHGSRLATGHLLDLGHRTVHHVRGPHDWLEAEARVRGWQAELSSRRAVARECLVGDWTPESGYRAGLQLAQDPDVTAAFVANDQMALGVILGLHRAGRSVPGDVSIVGFDDIPEAGYLIPPLTTVRQDFAEVGRRCLQQLLALVHGTADGLDHLVVRPELVVRASTAPPGRASGNRDEPAEVARSYE